MSARRLSSHPFASADAYVHSGRGSHRRLRAGNGYATCDPPGNSFSRPRPHYCVVSPWDALRGTPMSRYRVTLRRNSVEIVTADNPYQAAIVASDLFGEGVEVADVRPAVGRAPSTARKAAKKSVKKV